MSSASPRSTHRGSRPLNGGYQLRYAMGRDAGNGSAVWGVRELPAALITRSDNGWQLLSVRPQRLPPWLREQMVRQPERKYTWVWSQSGRSGFATRGALLETLRLAQDNAEQQPAASVLTEALA